MLIIKMLKKITGLNQEQLANRLGVSRASINLWDNSEEEMTTYQKNIISKNFQIPEDLLTDDINTDIYKCKKLYSFIESKWNELNSKKDDIDYLDFISSEVKKDEIKESISDYEIIDCLTKGYNPYTGEVFECDHILNDDRIKQLLTNIKNKDFKYGSTLDKSDLDYHQKELFNQLKEWRLAKTYEDGFYSAYMVFNDKELINILTANIETKEDLLNVKGIGKIKYEKYGDDLFQILKNGEYISIH